MMNEEESIINYLKYGTHHPLNDIYNFAQRGLLHSLSGAISSPRSQEKFSQTVDNFT